MPDNQDSVMIVCDDKGAAAPTGWTRFENDEIIARRVTNSDFEKLDLAGYKAVLVKVYQYNDSGPNPYATEYSGQDGYAVRRNSATNRLLACKHDTKTGTTRNAHKESSIGGGTESEWWPKDQGQTPMEGVVFQDAAPSSGQLSAAQALDTDDVSIG